MTPLGTKGGIRAIAAEIGTWSLVLFLASQTACGQGWLPVAIAMLESRPIRQQVLNRSDGHVRLANYVRSKKVWLGEMVEQSGTNTSARWQARLNQDMRSVGNRPRINPRDRDDDGADDAFDRWPNDPTRW